MLKPPAWAKDAKPTSKGWINPRTGELLVSRKHSDREITEYYMAKEEAVVTAVSEPEAVVADPEPIIEADPEIAPEAELLTEADPDVDHSSLTKAQLVEHALEVYGITLDSSMTKAQMIEDLEAQI